jgi:hypothetical protein
MFAFELDTGFVLLIVALLALPSLLVTALVFGYGVGQGRAGRGLLGAGLTLVIAALAYVFVAPILDLGVLGAVGIPFMVSVAVGILVGAIWIAKGRPPLTTGISEEGEPGQRRRS